MRHVSEIGYLRWTEAKKFLDERGDNYNQVLLTDLRDVVFQGDVFEKYAHLKSFIGCPTEGMALKNKYNPANYNWVKNVFGQAEADKLADCEIICAGTVLATVDAMKKFLVKMVDVVKTSSRQGDDQATFNYLARENLLDVESVVWMDCWDGLILSAGFFHKEHPLRLSETAILNGNGGVPALVHQYPSYPKFIELVDKVYRDKNFQPDENFKDTRSMLEQIIHLTALGRIDEAYKFFAKHLHGRNFVRYVDLLLELWENILKKNFTPTSELLMLSVQGALASTAGNGFQIEHVSKMAGFTNFCMKNRIAVSFIFRLFAGNILFMLANRLRDAKQFEECFTCFELIETLEINLDQNYHLFKARICRETGKKSEALASYEKALNA